MSKRTITLIGVAAVVAIFLGAVAVYAAAGNRTGAGWGMMGFRGSGQQAWSQSGQGDNGSGYYGPGMMGNNGFGPGQGGYGQTVPGGYGAGPGSGYGPGVMSGGPINRMFNAMQSGNWSQAYQGCRGYLGSYNQNLP